jgi:glycosyltransferase involved in cell wall biosynthesis
MNILIANNRFFVSGGPERYMFKITEMLEGSGHRVSVFSNRYIKNLPSPYEEFFMPSPVNEDAVYYRDFKLSPSKAVKLLGRAAYSIEAKRRIQYLIQSEKPDIAYLLAIANYISPSIIDTLHSNRIPVVMRLSDFNLLCPAYTFFRNSQVCQECLTNGLHKAVSHRCLQDSRMVSLARVISMAYHRWINIYDKVDAFIAPSEFLMKVMIEAGFPSQKFIHLPSFAEIPEVVSTSCKERYILYVGRLSKEKGIDILIRAFSIIQRTYPDIRLVIAGERTLECAYLKSLAQELKIERVYFIGFVENSKLSQVYSNAEFTVVPSLWFENTPMSVYESHSYSKAVISSRIGSLPEQVKDGINGLLFEPGDPVDLAEKISLLLDNPDLAVKMGRQARERLVEELSPQSHLERLLDLFGSIQQSYQS